MNSPIGVGAGDQRRAYPELHLSLARPPGRLAQIGVNGGESRAGQFAVRRIVAVFEIEEQQIDMIENAGEIRRRRFAAGVEGGMQPALVAACQKLDGKFGLTAWFAAGERDAAPAGFVPDAILLHFRQQIAEISPHTDGLHRPRRTGTHASLATAAAGAINDDSLR